MAGPRSETGMLLPEGVDPNDLPDMKTLRRMKREQKRNQPKDKTLGRVLGYTWKYYKAQLIVVVVCIILSVAVTMCLSLMSKILIDSYITPMLNGSMSSDDGFAGITRTIIIFSAVAVVGIITSFTYNFLMASITQGTLKHVRCEMFENMQKLPIKYFDTHLSGDTMSCYTNDTDALRQLISQSIPQLINSSLTILFSVALMAYYSIWLLLVVAAAIFAMFMVVRKIGGNSSRYFMMQQQSLGHVNGYIEEIMHGQKVVKVFCHEDEAKQDFDEKNEVLYNNARLANNYANILMPIIGNIGNILYVIVAVVGATLIMTGAYNLALYNISPSVTKYALTAGTVVLFLQMSKSFSQSVNMVSQQFNAIAMALAGAKRIFALTDEKPEPDNGYVELVYAEYNDKGELVESAERTGLWAWKHPHRADGSITYHELKGDIEMHDVDFGYNAERLVLKDVIVSVKSGQKPDDVKITVLPENNKAAAGKYADLQLVLAQRDENDKLVETDKCGNAVWTWKNSAGDAATYQELAGEIKLSEVDLGYDSTKLVLKDITLFARPGQHVAFVGSTGAGKTTITNLINRFYDIADGKIRYDGININKIKKSDLRRSLGIVLQDTNLFTGTVKENIKYGKLDATDDEVIKAAKIANAHDFIMRLPDGYDTTLESDGMNLSQGQRQLLSIARAACADAPVMILDEATSSIDTRTERLVQEGTNKLMEGRTVFIIAHRLSTIHNADVIMVLEKGRIIERGNHEQLIAQKGTYHKLYTGAFELE